MSIFVAGILNEDWASIDPELFASPQEKVCTMHMSASWMELKGASALPSPRKSKAVLLAKPESVVGCDQLSVQSVSKMP